MVAFEEVVYKPTSKCGVVLPAYFRQLFGSNWDILYGLLVLSAYSLSTWWKVEESYVLILLVTYVDVFVAFDAAMSLFVRFYQAVQVVAVNRTIEAVWIALQMIASCGLDLFSCTPLILTLLLVNKQHVFAIYKFVCLLRLARLLHTDRKSPNKDLYERICREASNQPQLLPNLSEYTSAYRKHHDLAHKLSKIKDFQNASVRMKRKIAQKFKKSLP